jgi:hypothetical protein
MSFPSTHGSLSNGQRSGTGFGGSQSLVLSFKPSPFYQIEAQAGDVKACDGKSYAYILPLAVWTCILTSLSSYAIAS